MVYSLSTYYFGNVVSFVHNIHIQLRFCLPEHILNCIVGQKGKCIIHAHMDYCYFKSSATTNDGKLQLGSKVLFMSDCAVNGNSLILMWLFCGQSHHWLDSHIEWVVVHVVLQFINSW